jgi:hypothetical protein
VANPEYALRLDPWAAEYEGSIQLVDGDEPAAVDTRVERAAWEAVRPPAAQPPERIAFVDGVRRIEHRFVIEGGESGALGLLGSFGTGAVVVDRHARVAQERIGRVAVVGGGFVIAPLRVAVGEAEPLVFEPRSESESTPAAPVDGLQKAMRQGEASLAEQLSGAVDVVFQDGPLSFVGATAGAGVVGFVKRLLRNYLEPAAHALLPRLRTGERTPVFLIEGREPRYSWYQRIALGRPIESALTGVVRLETKAAAGVEQARRLADLSARELPRFASDSTRDPRAPQNLLPIGGLEARLKHLLGDPLVVRRAIEAHIHGEVGA